MQFRTVARMTFAIGASSCVMALLFNWSRDQAVADSEFVAATTAVTDENFEDVVLASEKPVVCDFYGDYCGVCRKLEPQFAELAQKHSDAAVFARVNVQHAPELIEKLEIQEVPTLVVIHEGELLFRGAGLAALPPMQAALEATITGKLP